MLRVIFLCLPIYLFSCKSRSNSARLAQSKATPKEQIDKLSQASEILQAIKDKKITSLEGLIEKLPSRFFKEGNYMLFSSSRSRCSEDVNKDFPRVLLFDNRTGLFIAYTGNPKGKCHNTVELIQTVVEKKDKKAFIFGTDTSDMMVRHGYEFYAIDFDKIESDKRTFKQRTDCHSCHGLPDKYLKGDGEDLKKFFITDNIADFMAPIWKKSTTIGRIESGIWPRTYGKNGVLEGDEITDFKKFVKENKKSWPYVSLEGDFDTPRGGQPVNSPLREFGKEKKTETVPHGAAFDRLDSMFDSDNISPESAKTTTELRYLYGLIARKVDIDDYDREESEKKKKEE